MRSAFSIASLVVVGTLVVCLWNACGSSTGGGTGDTAGADPAEAVADALADRGPAEPEVSDVPALSDLSRAESREVEGSDVPAPSDLSRAESREVEESDGLAPSDSDGSDGLALSDSDGSDPGGPDGPPPILADPTQWGPYKVGTVGFQWFDVERLRLVPTTVWYPAIVGNEAQANYLGMIKGKAYTNAGPNKAASPYPLLLFSHGFRGTAVQSVTFTEFVASHGYVVAAMDHQGNTLFDFFSSDEDVAKVAIERPNEVRFVYEQVVKASQADAGVLSGMVDASRVAVSGHSFGGWTALVVAGGQMDVSQAQAACAAGTPSDIFCDYVGYWPAGEIVKMDPAIPALKAAVSLAPGGYSAFGDTGLAAVYVPVAVFGGTLDDTCAVGVEIEPIYAAMPPPKGQAVITNASHMSFTNVCDLPLAQQWLADFCNVDGMLGPEETFAVANTIAISFLNVHVKDLDWYAQFLDQAWLDAKYGYVSWKSE